MSSDMTPYPELAEVLASLPLLVREARRARRLSVRAAAAQMGVAYNTVARVESGEGVGVSTAVAVLRWLDTPAGPPKITEEAL